MAPINFKPRGFTLIEVMVATVLIGLMGILLMSSLNSSIRAKDSVEQLSERYHEVRQAMARMSREISMAYLSKHISMSEPAYYTQFKGTKERLFFSAFGHVVHHKDAKQSDQQVLGFYIANDKQGRQSLMRRFQAGLNLDVESGGHAQVLCANVSKLEFSYYDSRMDRWDESWIADPATMVALEAKEQKATESENIIKPWRLPGVVKISMTVTMDDDTEMTWVSETEIPVQEPLDLN